MFIVVLFIKEKEVGKSLIVIDGWVVFINYGGSYIL